MHRFLFVLCVAYVAFWCTGAWRLADPVREPMVATDQEGTGEPQPSPLVSVPRPGTFLARTAIDGAGRPVVVMTAPNGMTWYTSASPLPQ